MLRSVVSNPGGDDSPSRGVEIRIEWGERAAVWADLPRLDLPAAETNAIQGRARDQAPRGAVVRRENLIYGNLRTRCESPPRVAASGKRVEPPTATVPGWLTLSSGE